jgi:hypothetical protein
MNHLTQPQKVQAAFPELKYQRHVEEGIGNIDR